MGATVSKVISALSDKSDGLMQEMKEALTVLQRKADHETETFYDKITHSSYETNKLVPIKTVLYKHQVLNIVDSQKDNISEGVKNVVDSLTQSNIAGALTSVVSTALDALLKNTSNEVSVEESYTINIGKLGGVERIDYRMSKRSFTSSSYKTTLKSVVSVIIVVSCCDISQIKPNDYAVLIQKCFGAASYNIQLGVKDLLELIKDESLTEDERQKAELPIVQNLQIEFENSAPPVVKGVRSSEQAAIEDILTNIKKINEDKAKEKQEQEQKKPLQSQQQPQSQQKVPAASTHLGSEDVNTYERVFGYEKEQEMKAMREKVLKQIRKQDTL